ncbi:uncharacterized protein [Palaemon carinicauda]|uniref:uncharacterized protein n=1 Tax=Palaemon carinicauda TaxID=392227 RepID=UPI0035B5E532
MDTNIIFHLFLVYSYLSVASSQSAIMGTDGGNTTTVVLSKLEALVVAMRPTLIHSFVNYTFAVNQEVLHRAVRNLPYFEIHWEPLLIISKELMRRPYDGTEYKIPVNDNLPSERTLTVSSVAKVSWQIFPLPLVDNAVAVMSKGSAEYIDLPVGDSVFVALWNGHGREFRVDFRLFDGKMMTLDIETTNAKKGWSLICINENYLVYEGQYYWAKGRRLWMFVFEQIHYQVFAMPLEPKDTGNDDEKDTKNSETPVGNENKSVSETVLAVIIAVLVTSVVLVALYSGYRIILRKRNERMQRGTARTNMDFENSLYGVVILR